VGGEFVIFDDKLQQVGQKPRKMNELELERPYLQRNIALTQQAYNLHQVTAAAFPAEQSLTAKALEANKPTIDNIRLWDWQPLMDTYSQMQEIRTYYRFARRTLARRPMERSRLCPTQRRLPAVRTVLVLGLILVS
jgi:uncharacterized membrane protein (UPF0182 family)